ncbi:MAG: SMI1/KNR4 family protein [Proteobacteria bacterium]|nr:SMI1/KNR4 family protein [Pseudomonadota bacterium]
MWKEIVERIGELRELDSHNKYKINPVASDAEIKAFEKQLGVELPEQLRRYYLEVGNGGPWIYDYQSLENLNADKPWMGVDFYEESDENFDNITGLLSVMGGGYAHDNYVITNGPECGQLMAYSDGTGFLFKVADNLIEQMHVELDVEIEPFNRLKRYMNESEDVQTIAQRYRDDYQAEPANILVRLASLMGFEFSYHPDGLNARKMFKDENKNWIVTIEEEARQFFNQKIAQFKATGQSHVFTYTKRKYRYMDVLFVSNKHKNNSKDLLVASSARDWSEPYPKRIYKLEMTPEASNESELLLNMVIRLMQIHKLKPQCLVIDGGDKETAQDLYNKLNEPIPVICLKFGEGKDKIVSVHGINQDQAEDHLSCMDRKSTLPTPIHYLRNYS